MTVSSAVDFARFDVSTGRYTTIGTVPSNSITLLESDVYVGKVDPLTQYHTASGPVSMPPRPSRFHDFDWESKSWVENSSSLRSFKRSQIEIERDRKIASPVIVYDGKRLDADATSIDLVAKKLNALDAYERRGQAMPANRLVWRDADNITHQFATHADYKAWLSGLAIALDDRGTAAFSWSWQKKAQLDALTTFEEVMAFDTSN